MTLHDLFVEYNTTSLNVLINIFGNRIDWYTEMLYDFPWDTVAQSNLDHTKKVLGRLVEIRSFLSEAGVDWDIDANCVFAKLLEI